jgi:sRNA-binding protein
LAVARETSCTAAYARGSAYFLRLAWNAATIRLALHSGRLTQDDQLGKNQNTFEKRRREIEKRQRAEEKRKRRQKNKESAERPEPKPPQEDAPAVEE